MPDDLWLTDTYTWSLQQADLLRRLRAGERPKDLDWDNIIEEIESVGRSHKDQVESLVVQSALHLMKIHAWPDSTALRKWRADARDFLIQAQRIYRPSMARDLDLAGAYRYALRRIPYDRFTTAPQPVPTNGTIPLAAVADEDFSIDDLAAALFPPR